MTLPDAARTQLRTYFEALVPPRAVDDAVEDVADRFAHRSPDPPALFATAHTVLEEYGRVAFEVEVDVLVHDLDLAPRYAAIATGSDVDEVEAALEIVAAAASELGLDRDVEAPSRRVDTDEITVDRVPQAEKTAPAPPPEDLAEKTAPAPPPEDLAEKTFPAPPPDLFEDEPAAAPEPAVHERPQADVTPTRETAVVRPEERVSRPDERESVDTVATEPSVSHPSRRGPLLAIVTVFAVIALLVVVASALA